MSELSAERIDAIRKADEAASVAHDFIWGENGVTKWQASDAIWQIHNALRPFYMTDHAEATGQSPS